MVSEPEWERGGKQPSNPPPPPTLPNAPAAAGPHERFVNAHSASSTPHRSAPGFDAPGAARPMSANAAAGPWVMRLKEQPLGVVQVAHDAQKRYGRLPEHILRLAQAEYERQYGHQQDYERMQERCGLELGEVIGFLADYIDYLGGKPTTPRAVPIKESPNERSDGS